MVPGRLSVIIPFVSEHPQIAFTVQNIASELRAANIDFEIIAVNNWCEEVAAQGRTDDGGGKYLQELFAKHGNLVYLEYTKKLSHWNSKNLGVSKATGEFLFFIDSHCLIPPGALRMMYWYYVAWHKQLNGTLHMPITYMLDAPEKKLVYRLVADAAHGIAHYTFTALDALQPKPTATHLTVPCMSTCGMMMTRSIYDEIGGWPTELGIYGGGENFINFVLAICRLTVNVFVPGQLFHYAAPRGYHWNWADFHRNRMIASMMYGGPEWAERFAEAVKGPKPTLRSICYEVTHNRECIAHREHIAKRQKITIDKWLEENVTTAQE